MSQYMTQKSKDFKHLRYALDHYTALFFHVSPLATGNDRRNIFEDLKNKKLNFSTKNGLSFFTDRELIHFPLKDYASGFKVEYQEKNGARIYPYDLHPTDPKLQLPATSVFRNAIDDLLLEIGFEGKIKLELDEQNDKNQYPMNSFWKLAKIK